MPGGGCVLLAATDTLDLLKPANVEQKAGADAVRRALEAPFRQIVENAGIGGSVAMARLRDCLGSTSGIDARTGEVVDMIEAGIIDRARVVRTALQVAGSVAGMLVTTEAAVAEHVDEPHAPPAALASAY